MHLNKQQQHNKLLHNEKNYDLNYTNKTATTSLEIEATSDKIRNITTLGDTFTGTANSCTSSTDSGVNVSDSEIPPSPSPTSQILSSSSPFASTSQSTTIAAATTTATANPFNPQYYRNNKTTNVDDDKNNINNFHDIVDDDDDEVVQTLNNSKNIDKKYKSEESKYREQPQSFVKVAGSSSNENNYNNQTTTIKSENVINFSHPPDTLAAAEAAAATSTTNDSRSRHDHDCRDHPTTTTSTRSTSTSPSLSMSSTNSFTHPPSKTHINRSPNVSIRSIDSSVIDSDSDSDLNDDIEGEHENYVIKKLGTQVSYPPKHPDIPNINRGLTVLNQHVTPHGGGGGGQMPPNPIAALSAIGDSLGAAQALGPVPANSAIANNRPQIGSIALSNSSDVTFGDKHFYEGPVTIQQFLIDGRDKWKESNGKENPLFESDNNDTPRYAKDINPPAAAQPSKLYGFISKRKMYVIAGALSVMTLLIVAAILGSEALNDNKSKIVLGNSEESRKNIPINSTIDVNVADDECDVNNGSLCLLDRHDWQGHPQKQKLDGQKLPLHRAIISHTASEACDSLKECQFRVRVIQEFHMNSFGWDDIGYNFLISSDGRVYVGRGWDDIGAHTKGYNSDSVGIAFIGTYMSVKPTEAQLKACQLLLEEGVRLKKLVPNYHLYGARQFAATESPGDMLYKIIKSWDHWSANINPH